MAKTSKGIYYPYDYNKIADVPEDMKQMAESINKILETKEIDETTQDAKITDLQNKVIDLQQENTDLASNMPWNTTAGESLHIEDSAKYSRNRLSLSGNLRQEKRSGKNKFIPLTDGNNGGITISKNEDGTYNLSGTATTDVNHTAFIDLDKSEIKNNVAYILSSTKNLPAGVSSRVEMYNGTSWLRPFIPSINSTTHTSTGTANTTNVTKIRFGIFVASGTTVNIQNLGLQLEEGTTATEFEKYGATPSTEFPSIPLVCTGVQKIITCKKNILNTQKNASSTSNGATVTTDENGIITVNGTTLGATYIKLHDDLKVLTYSKYLAENEKKYFSRGKYILSFKYISGTKTNGNSSLNLRSEFSEPDVNVSITGINIENKNIKFELTDNLHLLTYLWLNSNVTFTNYKIAVQIEKVDTLDENTTDYESYDGIEHTLDLKNTELCAIKDTNGNVVAKDRHVFRNGKWQWEKIIRKRVLNGTEDWQSNSNWNKEDTEIYHAYINLTDWKIGQKDVALDKFKFYGYTSWGDCKGKECCACNVINRFLYIFISTDKLETKDVAGLKKWLQNNNITMYYILATPEYIDCTAEQSAVLDKLYNNFELQQGTNNIIVESSNGVGVNLELDYMQDNILKDKKLEDRVTALEDLLSTTQTSALLLDNLQNDLESEVN